MTKDELLEYANKHYPIGTQYQPLGAYSPTKAKYHAKYTGYGIEVGLGFIWREDYPDKWAEIISKDNYSIFN